MNDKKRKLWVKVMAWVLVILMAVSSFTLAVYFIIQAFV